MQANKYSNDDIRDNTIFSVLCYVPGGCVVIPLIFARNSKYCRFHINQGLILFFLGMIFGMFSYFMNMVIGWLPILGTLIANLANVPIGIFYPFLVLIGFYNVYKGEAKPLPFVGHFKILKS